MEQCDFEYLPNPGGICNTSIEASARSNFAGQTMFMNCTDVFVSYTLTISNFDESPLNGTLLFILDNSDLFTLGAHSK